MLEIFDKYKTFKKEDVKSDLTSKVWLAKDKIIKWILNIDI
jgi:hypothetical protein